MENNKRFAVISGDMLVENIIAAEDIAYVLAFFEDKLVVEETADTGVAFIGLRYSESLNKFEPIQMNDGWSFDEETFTWISPIPYPESGGPYTWFSPEQRWKLISEEE